MLNRQAILILFRKELLCFFKNKEALFIMVIMPIFIYPFIFLISGDTISQMILNKATTPLEINFIQVSNVMMPQTPDLIGLHNHIKENLKNKDKENSSKKKIALDYTIRPIVVSPIIPPLIADDQIQIAFYPKQSAFKKGEIQIYFNSENDLAFAGKNQIQNLIDDYNLILFKKILKENNIAIEMMQPIVIREPQNIAPTEHSLIKYGGSLLAILLIFLTYISCQYAATEVLPAEREQLTLETLLATPLAWHDIIIGKYLAIVVAGFLNALLNLVGMLTFGGSIISSMANMGNENFSFQISILRILMILFSLIPLSFMCAAVSMLLISFARTRMSASYFSVPGMLLVISPAMLTLLPNTLLQGIWIVLPFANMTLYIRNLILGDVSAFTTVAVLVNVIVFSFIISALSISISNHKDKILSGGLNFTLFHRPKTMQPSLTIFEGVFAFLISTILFFTLGFIMQSFQEINYIMIPLSFFICFFLPSFLFMKYKKVNIPQFLNFNIPTWQQIIGGILFVVPLITLVQIASVISQQFLQDNSSKETLKFILDFKAKNGIILLFIAVAVTPGFFEEFIMRGILFQSIKKQLKPVVAIILTGAIFSLFHGFSKMFPLLPAGILLTWLMYRTNCIFIPMLAHMLFNSFSLYFADKPTEVLTYTNNLQNNPNILTSTIVFIIFTSYLSFYLLTKFPQKRSNEI